MIIETAKDVLLWSSIINYGILLLWGGVFIFAHDWLYNLHSRWFNLSPERFDTIHYGLMAAYKLTIFAFYLVPFIALVIAT